MDVACTVVPTPVPGVKSEVLYSISHAEAVPFSVQERSIEDGEAPVAVKAVGARHDMVVVNDMVKVASCTGSPIAQLVTTYASYVVSGVNPVICVVVELETVVLQIVSLLLL